MYEGAGEAIPMVDVPVPVGQARRSFHRIAFICGLGGAAVLAWHIFRKLKAAQQEREAKEKAEAIISKEKTVAESEAEINNNNRWRHPLRNPLPTVQVVIHQCPRGYLTPCISPFSLKLETYLRVAGIPYEVDFTASQEDGNVPWMSVGGEDVRESYECISKINQVFNLNLEANAPQSRNIASRLVSIMLENHIYWGIALWRWVYDHGRTLPHIQPLSATSMATIDDIGSSVNRAAWYHGLGRLSPQQVTDLILKDLGDLSSALGKHPYFLGDSPGEVDCAAFAMLSQMVWNMPGSPFEPGVKQYRNLVDFVLRMRDNFWPDWQNLLQVRGEEKLEEVGIFPGSEFLHKRQLNSDSSHWDSKGSSSITLKDQPQRVNNAKQASAVNKNNNEAQVLQEQSVRPNHVTFEQSPAQFQGQGQVLPEAPQQNNAPAPSKTNTSLPSAVQQIPQGILRAPTASSSASSHGPVQGQQGMVMPQQQAMFPAQYQQNPMLGPQRSDPMVQTSQSLQFQQQANIMQDNMNMMNNARLGMPYAQPSFPLMYPHTSPSYPLNYAYPPPEPFNDGRIMGYPQNPQALMYASNAYGAYQSPLPSNVGAQYQNEGGQVKAYGSSSGAFEEAQRAFNEATGAQQ